jgi:hypothetical protein
MNQSRKWIWLVSIAGFALAMFPASLFAGTAVTFATADLDAFVQLARPDQTTIRIDGLAGEIHPGNSLRFAGLEDQTFDVDLNFGGALVDLRFNNLRAKTPKVSFEADRIRLDIALEDQAKAIRSALGSISLNGVTLTAWVRFAADGSTRIVYDKGAITGELKGSGLLKPKWVIDAVKSVALKSLKTQVERQLARSLVQDSVAKGFVLWSRFSTDPRFTRVSPGTVKVSADGIHFEAD